LEEPLNMKEPEEHRQKLSLHIVSYLLKMTSDENLNFCWRKLRKKTELLTHLFQLTFLLY
jgi:hypothetical protein